MFNIPEQYSVQVKIPIKEFIPKELKPDRKKRIKDSVKEVRLISQIAGEEIPSVINYEHRCQVIQIYEIEVHNIKDASFIATTYQNIIKSLCVLKISDAVSEVYSFALKRLNQVDDSQIVLTDEECTECFQSRLPDRNRSRFLQYMSYDNIVNKTNKVNYYLEMYAKTYMIQNEKAYSQMDIVLQKPIWYDAKRIAKVYMLLKEIVDKKDKVAKVISNSEKVQINQEIKTNLAQLGVELE